MTLDFEKALWYATTTVFGLAVFIFGYNFHWAKLVWARIQEVGLQERYKDNRAVRAYLGKLMALPYLPAEHIKLAFEDLKKDAVTTALEEVCSYMEKNWFNSTTWTPQNFSVFMCDVRTNNNVEGWHDRLNRDAQKPNLGFYPLVHLLYAEAKMTKYEAHMVMDGKLGRTQKKACQEVQDKLDELWKKYESERDPEKLLNACRNLVPF